MSLRSHTTSRLRAREQKCSLSRLSLMALPSSRPLAINEMSALPSPFPARRSRPRERCSASPRLPRRALVLNADIPELGSSGDETRKEANGGSSKTAGEEMRQELAHRADPPNGRLAARPDAKGGRGYVRVVAGGSNSSSIDATVADVLPEFHDWTVSSYLESAGGDHECRSCPTTSRPTTPL